MVRYIERDFPVERLNPVALAEGNSKKPIYQMHKWWARRLGSVFRMITLAAFAPADVPEETLWSWFAAGGADLEGKIVLDPFMGGGTTVVEALRLGCRVVGVDINPVAWFVTKKEIEPVSLADLDRAFHFLEETAGQKLRQYYRTTCPAGHGADVMYYFWVKVAECEECGATVRLWPNTELADADRWIRRTLNSGLPVNPVDVFTVVMGKTVEFYTRAAAEGAIEEREGLLAELIAEMAGEAQEMGKALAEKAPSRARQLALF